jgi:hypothetical protein
MFASKGDLAGKRSKVLAMEIFPDRQDSIDSF